MMRAGADTGGTFTDVVGTDGAVAKVLSTPDEPATAVQNGLEALGGRCGWLAHGTTVATNALLERRGARVALVTTSGLEDVIEIARQDRPSLYDPFADRSPPLVERGDRLGVGGRLGPTGEEITAVEPGRLELPRGVEAVAVCLLHADLDGRHEREILSGLGELDVSISSDVAPQHREYERTVTTVLNAYLRPVCRRYLDRLASVADHVAVMTSAGGLVDAAVGAEFPVHLLLSGPAGGVHAAAAVARANGFPDAISFDMGGTSTDVCLIRDGRAEPAGLRTIDQYPVLVPALDILTIGAGGGSIAGLDPGGALVVGPRSAGASPGPACYGLGGTEPTVTDADLVSGRIPAGAAFPGLDELDERAARDALARAGIDAEGVIRVVNANMERALRAVSVERGVDPRSMGLVAFGGAGGLHACELADALGMDAVIIPPRAGVLSAAGLLCAPEQRDVVRSWATPSDHRGLEHALADLGRECGRLLGEGATVTTAVDARYAGQSHELTVEDLRGFHQAHEERNGFSRPGAPVEVVTLRASAIRSAPIAIEDLPPVERDRVVGPAVMSEPDCTVYVPEGWIGTPGEAGALIVRRSQSG